MSFHGSDLGQFSLSYLGQTDQITQRQLTGSTLSTNWSYLPNSGDRRLAGIANVGVSAGQTSTYQYTTSAENLITSVTETSDAAASYPPASSQAINYNNLNQATNVAGQALAYDANGNLLSDGSRLYAWDAENRLVQITYTSASGKKTSFNYDGLSRRTSIASTPAGGGSIATTSYIWCGNSICQARAASGQPSREYFIEGEYLPGAAPQPLYYGQDQIGSVRRIFQSTGSAPAYSYDPYGVSLDSTPKQADFNFAGMLFNADSSLYFAQNRIYNPAIGRWLSRDPLSEESNDLANLYAYVQGNPISFVDPAGLWATGFSFSLSTINPFTSGGGGNYGINLEYTSDCGVHLYRFGTPNDQASSGFSVGVGASVNVAIGQGSWEGPFLQDEGNIGPAAGGGFMSPGATPDNGYIGGQIGVSAGPPFGLGATVTNYTVLW